MFRRILVWAVLLGITGLILWVAFKPQSQPGSTGGKNAGGDRPQTVVTVRSKAEDVPVRVEAQGTVVPLDQVALRPQIASTIRSVHVREGEEVQAGQKLFTLDGRVDEARMMQTSAQRLEKAAQLAEAERQLGRNKELLKQGFVAQSAVDASQSSVDALRAGLNASEAALAANMLTLGFSTLSAPIAGRVGAIDVHRGSLVQPGSTQPLLTIARMDPIEVQFSLPERDLPRILQAQAAGPVSTQALPDPQHPIPGSLSFIDNAVDAATGTIRLKARFPNPDRKLWPGLFTRVTIDLGLDKQVVTLPTGAIQTGPNGQFVFLVQPDDTVIARPVSLLRVVTQAGRQLAIVSGLPPGQLVVAEGGQNLRPGGKVVAAKTGAGKGEGRKSGAEATGQPAGKPKGEPAA